MSSPPLKRRLVTILATDAVGYSRMMSESEEETMHVLAAHRAVIDGIIQFHEGRIINTAGDSVLAEFASPVQAVRCAVEIQDALKTRNDALPEGRRLMFRIGINLGDVMVKGDDLLGDGVNVAARLESIAEPGGICISSSVYDQISGKLDLRLQDIGEQSLKNITRPIRTFRIHTSSLAAAAAPAKRHRAAGTRRVPLAGMLLAAAAAGGALWYALHPAPEPPGAHTAASPDAAEAARLRAEAEAQRLRDEAEKDAARIRAQAQAERGKAESEAARLRSEAEQAHLKSEAARARAEAEAARAAALAQSATERSKAQEEAARIRAEAEREAGQARAEAARLKAEAEAAAAAQRDAAKAAAAAPAPLASRYDGAWRLTLDCPPAGDSEPRLDITPARISSGQVLAESGTDGQPGYYRMQGLIGDDGHLVLEGFGYPGRKKFRGKQFSILIPGKFVDGNYEGEGHFGGRRCRVGLSR